MTPLPAQRDVEAWEAWRAAWDAMIAAGGHDDFSERQHMFGFRLGFLARQPEVDRLEAALREIADLTKPSRALARSDLHRIARSALTAGKDGAG